MAGSPLKNLRMFVKLCGDDALSNVILTMTMWDRVELAIGEQREKELEAEYWKGMIANGSQTQRFDGSFESAWEIIDTIAKKRINHLLLQEELVDLKRQLSETQAGMVLYNQLQTLLAELQNTLRKLRDEAASSNDPQLAEALHSDYEMIQKKLQSTFDQVTTMKVSFGRRLVLRFSRKPRIVSSCHLAPRSPLILRTEIESI
jgi:exonuclease VII small subunit